ncbi:hypothetical protein [Curtobacterium sp. MCSS17_016]|uniref:hypothetical protein n=1 Tax=Curtobacterium sp. MCSS17_016 TaxID=2175644 RepID=UPI000DA7D9A3|nr:hypothetical protein [Curtobacterium sp. MCSS17_016]WIE81242.1 hypothetical protein DEJ19_018585 [Curtobacterium sp. MCSS17_016]
MTGAYTAAGDGDRDALRHGQALIETAVQDSYRPEDEAAVSAVERLITRDAAARRLLDTYQGFLGDLNDQVNIMAARDDARDVISKMLFGFTKELRQNPDVGTVLGAAEH